MSPQVARKFQGPTPVAELNWEGPLDLEEQLTEEERMIRDATCDRAAECCAVQRMPDSISGTRSLIVCGVTTPAPVLRLRPGILYFAVSTHCSTGTKPWR